jgi:hypothetical protein
VPVARGSLFLLVVISLLLSGCSFLSKNHSNGQIATISAPPTSALPTLIPPGTKPLEDITSRDLFQEYLGKSDAERTALIKVILPSIVRPMEGN